MDIKLKTRDNKDIILKEDKSTLFLYNNAFGRLILKIIYNKSFSKLNGLYLDSKLSKHMIKKFIKNNNINMKDYEEKDYTSFNDFFTRKIKPQKREIIKDKNILISPCDGKLLVYKIEANSLFKIKNSLYRVKDLINNDIISKEYLNGYALVFRLCVDDYHRYSYIDDGYQKENHIIDGVLHTVRPIAENKFPIFKLNQREWTVLHTKNFDNVIEIDVGALMVGKIVNINHNNKFIKGEEKGYFKFGGSTIILLFKDNIKIDNDIISNSNNNIETIVKLGMKIGQKK